MQELKCPNCGKIFTIDEQDYNSILTQIRTHEFEQELQEREKVLSKEKETAIKLAESTFENKLNEELNKKDLRIKELENKVSEEEKSRENVIKLTEANIKNELSEELNKKEIEINNLKNQIDNEKKEFLLKEKNQKEIFESKIKDKDEQIEYYRDLKAKSSTKMIGESLEVHCSNEFNKLRPLFKNSYFEKDNDVKTGSKGDFIFRDYDDEGTEIVSIMFEMKNEADTTSTKHKNEDFLKELDKDRTEKNCEYAVLVSLLEIDNDYYNQGIVDVSHKYPKMYVIRPQFFIPIITLISSAASNVLDYKKELINAKNQNIDISNFEANINKFKEGFGRNYRLASDKFKKAIEEIDKSIKSLEKTKEDLLSSEKNLRLANEKAEELTIDHLTKNAPSVKEMFDEKKD